MTGRCHQPSQGYLAHKKYPPPRTLQWDYAQVPMVFLGGGLVSYERGIPVERDQIDYFVASICTRCRRIPVSASTH